MILKPSPRPRLDRENRGLLPGCATAKAGIVGLTSKLAGERAGTEHRLLSPPSIENLRWRKPLESVARFGRIDRSNPESIYFGVV